MACAGALTLLHARRNVPLVLVSPFDPVHDSVAVVSLVALTATACVAMLAVLGRRHLFAFGACLGLHVVTRTTFYLWIGDDRRVHRERVIAGLCALLVGLSAAAAFRIPKFRAERWLVRGEQSLSLALLATAAIRLIAALQRCWP